MPALLGQLGVACGEEWVSPATGADAAAGGSPRYVARPSSTPEVAALLRVAAEHGLRVVSRGAGTKLGWGNPAERADLVIDLGRLDRILEYAPGDLVIRVEAGVPLGVLQDGCAPAGQMLGLDPLVAGGTVGGTLATNASGPYRMRYGTCRDLLIGITVVRADGTVAHSGGKVVKNVAGYDLGKLYIGSFGTLGVITEAVFRLHPRPVARAVAAVELTDPAAAGAAAQRVRASQLAVSAIEVNRPDPTGPLTVAALVEGPGDIPARASRTAELLGPAATVTAQPALPEPLPHWWGTAPWPAGGTGIKLAVRLSRLPGLLAALGHHGTGLPIAVRGSLGAGVLYAGLPADTPPDAVIDLVRALRTEVPPGDGSVVVLCSPVVAGLDRWGPANGLDLMRRVKHAFDPDRRLAPGRLVGGI
jgi:glycolate oxidase FAD binding subunit